MTVVGRFLASNDGISDRGMSAMESCRVGARPLSLSSAGCSSVYMTGIRGATPPPAA
jgi:hypothetical protein